MNIDEAKQALAKLSLDTVHMLETVGPRNVLRLFIRDAEAAQAQIDRLMFEFCPDEMTEEQIATWAKHQKRAPDRWQSNVDKLLLTTIHPKEDDAKPE